jgi:DNA invertase Pin-like site-specific DNA recombinase
MNLNLRGKCYISYARCAAVAGSAPKLRRQIRIIRQFGDSFDMKCAGEIRLAGVSGVTPTIRPDLQLLLERKRQRNDFEMLLVEDLTRLTRSGLDGAREIEAAFGECGVQILCLTDLLLVARSSHHGQQVKPRNALRKR